MRKPIRVFLASPDDVTEERNRVQHVIEQLNHSRTLEELALTIELIRWETHVRPEMGRPQEIVLQQLASATWDVFIGILWLKFGTPTGAVNPSTQLPYLSGTEEEFQAAYKRWQTTSSKWPRIMFYRCKRSPDNIDAVDPEQLTSVRAFFRNFSPSGIHPGLTKEYNDPEEFEDLLLIHLTDVLYEYRDSQIETSRMNSHQVVENAHSETPTEYEVTDIAWSEHDQGAIDYFISMYPKDRRDPLTNDNILNWLQRWSLVKPVSGDQYFTRTGALLFGPQDRHPVQTDVFISYHGKNDKLVRLEGMCLLHLAQEVIRELTPLWQRTWESPGHRDQTGKPIESHVYPQTAIVEAAVNLIIHRDYTSTEKAYIDIHDDKIIFTNPGYSQHTVESLLADSELERQPYERNNLIINIFSRTGLNQTQRRGIQRIRDSLRGNLSQGPDTGPPLAISSSQENNTFRLIIFAAKPPATSMIQGDIITVGGDFLGRDKFIVQHLNPDNARNQRNHDALRQAVHRFWIDGVLKSSLYHEALIHLNLEERPELVDKRPWGLVVQRPDSPSESLAPGVSLLDIFDQMNQSLLILGEPGSGKTTVLLELADALLMRAGNDPTQPTPVVLNLSSWAAKQVVLADWLITELRDTYHLPNKVAQAWVEKDELLLLLDGLDEVPASLRQRCAMAINDFHKEHLMPLVVSSRIADYQNIATKLQLQGAVVLQPLSQEQVNSYLQQIGADPKFIARLKEHDRIRELLTSPLFLSIVTMTVGRTDHHLLNGEETGTQLLFDTYIRTMFTHRKLEYQYTPQETLRWLRQIASTMMRQNLSVFEVKRGISGWYQQLVSWGTGKTPLNLNQFLDYATERIFLRRVGDSYIFVHYLLMEYFASLTDKDIARVTARIN